MKNTKITRVLVTGSSGVVGHGVSTDLVKNNYFVLGTSNKKTLFSSSKNFKNVTNINFSSKNFLKKIEKLIKDFKPQALINCAALLPYKASKNYRLRMNEINNKSVINLINLSIKNDLLFFINIGGHSIQEKLKDRNLSKIQKFYFKSKNIVEKKILDKKNKINIISLNILAPYGYILEETSLIPKFINKIKKNQNINIFSNGKRKQIFTFSEDVGAACRHIFKNNLKGAISFAGPAVITTKYLAKSIISIFAKKKIHISFNKNIKDKDGMAVKNYLKEKNKKKILSVKKHSLKRSLVKIFKYDSTIKIKNK
tara:strand:- start:1141 stop:2076 length:936 start_codon:yes stop_codon:yes gene_type:complete